jgi:AraC-like DNA-binding protein
MNYYTIPPPAGLSPYVRFFWVLEGNEPYTHRSMADVCSELVFHYKGVFDELLTGNGKTRSFTAGITGPARGISRFEIEQPFGIFGVYLWPGALQPLLGIPAEALTNQAPGLAATGIPALTELEEQVMNAVNNLQRAEILTRFFERRLRQYEWPEIPAMAAVQEIFSNGGVVSVSRLYRQYYISERQFERQFKKHTGLTPRLFARIVRFHRAMSFYGRTDVSLTCIAHECGYYDQPHFIHDFKSFSGHLPGAFFSGMAEGTEWRG